MFNFIEHNKLFEHIMKDLDIYINEMLLYTAPREKFIKVVKKEFSSIFYKTLDSSYNVPAQIKTTKDLKQLQITDNAQVMFFIKIFSEDSDFFFRNDILRDLQSSFLNFNIKQYKVKKLNGRRTPEYYKEHKDLGKLIYLGECYGYELTNISYGKLLAPYVAIKFSPVHQTQITKQVYSETDVLLHLTKTSDIEKIKTQGLLPNAKNEYFNYSERIYLIDRNEVLKHYTEFLEFVNKFKQISNTNKWSLVFIDLHRCNNSFYIDLDNSENYLSLYTKEKISHKAISLIINLEKTNNKELYYQIDYCRENPHVSSIEEVLNTTETLKTPYKYL